MIVDPLCKSPHIPLEVLDTMVEAEILTLSENPARLTEIKKRAAGEGSSDSGISAEITRIDSEIGRLMDMYQQDDASLSIAEIADRIATLHAERIGFAPKIAEATRSFNLDGARVLLGEIRQDWTGLDLRGRRALLVQLVDRVSVGAEGIRIDWSF